MAIRRPRPTVRLRLTLTYTVLLVVTGAALLGVSYLLVQHRETGPRTAVQIICTATNKNINVQPQNTIVSGGPTEPGALAVSKANCSNAVGAFYSHSFGAGSGQAAVSGGASGGVVGSPVRLPLPTPGPNAAEVSRLTDTVKASQAQALESFKVDSALALGLLTIVAFGLSWWMAGRALRPVHRITDAARTLSEHTLHARINLRGPNDELKQLADTFDAMLGRLDRAFQSQRRFVANASHELRTPLATERVLIDEALANRSVRPDELQSILEQLRTNSEGTERLLDALLLLARSERGVERWAPVDLSDAVSSVVEQSSLEASVANVTVSADVEPVVVSGDPGLLERLAGNLIENGIRHNVPGGRVSVTTRPGVETGVLEVINTGPVLDPAEVASLVEPFRRAGPDRISDDGGSGLGLSIVDAVVTAHGGTMLLQAPTEGGLHVRVELPVAGPVTTARPGSKSAIATM